MQPKPKFMFGILYSAPPNDTFITEVILILSKDSEIDAKLKEIESDFRKKVKNSLNYAYVPSSLFKDANECSKARVEKITELKGSGYSVTEVLVYKKSKK